MDLQNQIEIIKELIEATIELNGEYQEGWSIATNGEYNSQAGLKASNLPD